MIGAITDQDQQGYWGLANLASDPETGEMIAGRGAVWQTITNYYANQLVEYVQLLTGKLTPDQVTTGGDLVASMKSLGTGQTPSAEILDAPLRTNPQHHLDGVRTGIERLKLPDAGWMKPGMTMRSNDINTPGALDTGVRRLLAGRQNGRRHQPRHRAACPQPRRNSDRGPHDELRPGAPGADHRRSRRQRAARLDDADCVAVPGQLQRAAPTSLDRIRSTVSAYQCGMEAGFQDDLLLGLAQRLATGNPIMQADPLDAPVAFGRDWNFKKSDGSIDYSNT